MKVISTTETRTASDRVAVFKDVAIPSAQHRTPEMVASLMELGLSLLPGARLGKAEELAVVFLAASRGEEGITLRDVETFKQEAIRQGYVYREAGAPALVG